MDRVTKQTEAEVKRKIVGVFVCLLVTVDRDRFCNTKTPFDNPSRLHEYGTLPLTFSTTKYTHKGDKAEVNTWSSSRLLSFSVFPACLYIYLFSLSLLPYLSSSLLFRSLLFLSPNFYRRLYAYSYFLEFSLKL